MWRSDDIGIASKRSRRTGTSLNARFDGRFVQSHIKLREMKQIKETTVCESMHGGVRGRGSNPPTCSILYSFRQDSISKNNEKREFST